jgi:hypothetical protein
MESIIQQFGNLDILPVFVSLFTTITQPFAHSFHAVVAPFLPYMKSLFSHEPGLIGGIIFVLSTYSVAVMSQNTRKKRVFVTNEKPSSIYKEGFPSGLNNKKGGF